MNNIDRNKIPYHYMSKGCSNCLKIIVEYETHDYNNPKYREVMDRIGIREFCDDKCKLEYMLKKLDK